jgi:hypothetical protein
MALNQRKTTRWERVGTWMVEAGSLALAAVKAFLNFSEEDGLVAKGEKTASFAIRRSMYFLADYGLWGLSVAIFTTMKTFGFSLAAIFVTLWAFECLAAGAFVLFYEKTGIDFSLGEDFRRAKDAVRRRSRAAGYMVTLFVIALAVIWTGPEKIIIFFRKEIGSISRVILSICGLTAVQAFVWTVLYNLGYGLVGSLF